MNIDIIYVTYNSSKWIENNMDAILKSNYDLKKLNIYIVDNASTDNTVDKLFKEQKRMRGSVGCFEIIQESQNLGFGNANNLGASKGNSPIVCFLILIQKYLTIHLIN